MLGRQAKIVSPATLRRMLAYARQARQPKRPGFLTHLRSLKGYDEPEILFFNPPNLSHGC
jgi:hypothetical protein